MDLKEKIQAIVYLIVLVAILASMSGWSQSTTSMVTEWLIAILVSVILAGICGQIIEAASGSFFKTIFVVVPIGPFNFSISLFVILTVILKIVLF